MGHDFEYSNILFNYRISIRLCDYFLKVYQGLTIKTVRWREGRLDLSLARSGHCRWPLIVSLHAILSLVCLKCKRLKAFGRERQPFSTCALCSVLCEQRAQTAASLTRASCLNGQNMSMSNYPFLTSNFSNNSSILNLYTKEVTDAQIYFRACVLEQ